MVDLDAMQRDLSLRKAALDRAITGAAALTWLRANGPRGPQKSNEAIGVCVTLNYASALGGAKEARSYLEQAILEQFGEINKRAIELAELDITSVKGGE